VVFLLPFGPLIAGNQQFHCPLHGSLFPVLSVFFSPSSTFYVPFRADTVGTFSYLSSPWDTLHMATYPLLSGFLPGHSLPRDPLSHTLPSDDDVLSLFLSQKWLGSMIFSPFLPPLPQELPPPSL